jgi:flotillin
MLGRGNGATGGNGIGLGEGLASQLLSYQANKPILDKLLKEAGFEGDDAISSLLGNLDGAKPARPATPAAAPARPTTPTATPTQTIIPPAPKPGPKKD